MNYLIVAPLTGAWIEIPGISVAWVDSLSLPSRERGLKSKVYGYRFCRYQSLPSRERGLKLLHLERLRKQSLVAPLTGAWIEIAGIRQWRN